MNVSLDPSSLKSGFDYSVELLKRLIEIPTVSPAGEHYEEAAELLAKELERLGFEVNVIRVPREYQESKCKYASRNPRFIVLGRRGEGPRLHFNGHYDVVPGGSGWTVTDPFRPLIKEGRLYGRGAIDMKGGIAAVMGAFKAIREEGLDVPLTLEAAFVPDEEIGGDCGTGYLLNALESPPEYVILPEPSGLNTPWHGHKGAVWVKVYVAGRNAHASTPWHGNNAFLNASRLALELQSLISSKLAGKRTKHRIIPEEAGQPTASLGGVATVVGGGKTNQVPGEFMFTVDRRLIPEENTRDVLEELKSLVLWASVKLGVESRVERELLMEPAINDPGPLYNALRNSAKVYGIEVEEPTVCPGGLDMWYYTTRGSKALAYGPKGVLAHAPDEHIELVELEKLVSIFALLPFELKKASQEAFN